MTDHKPSKQMQESRQVWDQAAASFDDEPDHGLQDPNIRAAWGKLLKALLPPTPSTVLDIGCGTGSLTILLAELGYTVVGADFSPAMIEKARQKAEKAHIDIELHLMNAADPTFDSRQFDVILCRHLLWTLPEPDKVLQRWSDLLTHAGYLLLIEGYWHTGAGLLAQDILTMLPTSLKNVAVHNLSDQPELWDGNVTDERYALLAKKLP